MSSILTGKILDSAIVNGVSVVTSLFGDKKGGCAASWFAQVSFAPVLIMVSLTEQRYTYSLIKKSSLFNINILADNQLDLGQHFGLKSGHSLDKFKDITHSPGKNTAPIIPHCKAYAECRLIDTFKAGDHNLLIGEITHFSEDTTKTALLFKGVDYW
ncbi:MAG: flavin reductase family protein [Candidatus Omnitrophica bacterium]|nr:flavin reductase family protein [Candidatus Omnitrophota bacterium]